MKKVYEDLAPYYDRFMSHINYENESEALYRFLLETGNTGGKLLDVGAGSGGHILPLLELGIHVDGLDYSEKMLSVLDGKMRSKGLKSCLIHGDMRNFSSECRYDVIYSFGETVHHLNNIDEFGLFVKCARKMLSDGGSLLFSWQEEEYFIELLDFGDFYEKHGEDYLLWHADYNPDESFCLLNYTAFIEEKGLYRRIPEVHRLAVFYPEEIYGILEDNGFQVRYDFEELCFSEITMEEPYRHITVAEKK